jgi:hypothetical protein
VAFTGPSASMPSSHPLLSLAKLDALSPARAGSGNEAAPASASKARRDRVHRDRVMVGYAPICSSSGLRPSQKATAPKVGKIAATIANEYPTI